MKTFTLIELLVVIAIIGILTSLLLPSLSKARSKGEQAVCLSNSKQIYTATLMYLEDNNDQAPIDDINNHDTKWFNTLSPNYLPAPKNEGWAPDICKCPSGIDVDEKWQTTIAMNSRVTGKNQMSEGAVTTTARFGMNLVNDASGKCLLIDSYLNWRSNGSGNMTVDKVLEESGGGKIARHSNKANAIHFDGSGIARSASFLISKNRWDDPYFHPAK